MIISLYLSSSLTLKDLPTNVIKILETRFTRKNTVNFKIDIVDIYLKREVNKKYFKESSKKESSEVINIAYNTNEPIVYIYNTHSNEEYSYKKNDVYNITPGVKTASYILESELKKYGINSIVEENNVVNILNEENLEYKDSYKISRRLLENKKIENPSLMYFIDLHRDSVKRSATTVEIDGESYAKVMFLLGLENKNYQINKEKIMILNDFLNKNYQGLSRGIYEKQGKGVNGVYNQDFSENVFLIEIGGVENTIEEVNNTLKVISNCLYDYISKNS